MVLTVGTDCSGIEAPIEALKQIGIKFRHKFSSEINKHCIENIKKNYNPEIIYGDIRERKVSETPKVDLYVCGFPCQPFSTAGKRQGFQDERGDIFWSCFDYLKSKFPKYFILENVKGLLIHDKGKTFQKMLESLKSLNYDIFYKILNTKDYGIPQNRERLYIVGISKKLKQDFVWPKKKRMKNIKNYISDDVKDDYEENIRPDVLASGLLDRIPKKSIFVDFSFKKSNCPNSHILCSTILADSRLWCVPKKRYATPQERLKLQGFVFFRQSKKVSNRQMNIQIGNSMSVNVIISILKKLLKKKIKKENKK